MITTVLLAVTLASDTTITRTDSSKDMQFGRDKVTSYLLNKVGTLGCVKYSIHDTLAVDGNLYRWTGTLVCTR